MVPVITDAQRQQMDDLGFVVFENLFSPDEVAELDKTLSQFDLRMRDALAEVGGASGISRKDEIVFTDHIAERDEEVLKFVSRPEFVALATAFLGPDTSLYWNQTVYKQPEGERIFPWHQDDAYTPVDPSPYLTLWLAISDATEENGCISVLPGSHKDGLRPHENSPIGLVGHSADDPEQGILVPISAGSVIAFWSLTLHKSGANRSKGIRKAYVIQYSDAELKNRATGQKIPDLVAISKDGQAVR